MARKAKPAINVKSRASRADDRPVTTEELPLTSSRRGRKPKQAANAGPAPPPVDDISPGGEHPSEAAAVTTDEMPAKARPGRKPKQPQLAAEPPSGGNEAPAAVVDAAERGEVDQQSELQRHSPESAASAQAKPAAHWARATDSVTFDWPAIEQTASRDGPNQALAKLLIAARAEGANSRWPF